MKERAVQTVLTRRAEEHAAAVKAAEKKRAEAYAVPEISDAQKEYTSARFAALLKPSDEGNSAAEKAKKVYENALKKYGYSEDAFTVTPSCPLCGDTGNNGGALCKCVYGDYIKELALECDVERRAPFSFTDCNPVNADEEQKTALKKLYASMERFVDKYPDVKYNVLVFAGKTGTGKSCLAYAMARKTVLTYGRSALVRSAYELNNVFLACHTSYLSEREGILHDVMTADMLVIDDLGTEPMLKNVTVEYLQLLLEERGRNGLCTVVTTNMSAAQMLKRYGERIFSRLADSKNALVRSIPGKDLRLK